MAKVMISIPDDLLKKVDRTAKARHQKRSEFFKDAVLRLIEGGAAKRPIDDPEVREAYEYIVAHRMPGWAGGETSEEIIRKMRDSR